MGAGLSILLMLIALFLISAVVAIISVVITAIVTKGEKKKRKLLLAAVSPFLFLFGTFFLAMIGSGFVSEYKNVDMGIGDYWHVPLNDRCHLSFIDLPEQSRIACGDDENESSLIDEVAALQQNGNMVYGRHQSGFFFAVDLQRQTVTKYPDAQSLQTAYRLGKLDMADTMDFYSKRYREITKVPIIAVGLASLAIGIGSIVLLWRVVLYGFRRTPNSNRYR